MHITRLDQLSLHKLFTDGHTLSIPDYQRPYSWKEKMVSDYFEDITLAMEREQNEYFLGSLIFVTNPTGEYEILDGQQRLTTSVILLALLRDLVGEQNSVKSEEVQNNYLVQKGSPVLLTRGEDRSAFRRAFLEDEHSVLGADLSRLPKAFKTAVTTFHSLLSQKMEEDDSYAEKLLAYLLHSVNFVIMVTDDLSSAYTIFETINDRGTALEPKDLLKNYLLKEIYEECSKQADNETEHRAIFDRETDELRSLWQRAESADGTMNEALIMHREACTGVRTRKDLYKEMVLLIQEKGQKPVEFMDDWLRSIEAQQSLLSGELFNAISYKTRSNLQLLQNSGNRYWQPVLIAAIRNGYEVKDIEVLIYELERWIALSRIVGFFSSKLRDPSLQIIRHYLLEKKPIDEISIFIDQFLIRYRIAERAIENLMGDCYSQAWCRYILAKYEYEFTDASINRVIPFTASTQVEHILPQRMTAKEWTDVFTPQDHDRLVNTIGNLTLLIGNSGQLKSSKNQSASNKPFLEKLHIYKGLAKNDGMSAFHMTSSLSSMTEWTPEVIEERQKEIVRTLAEAWGIDIDNLEAQQEMYKEQFAETHESVSFAQGDFSDDELAQRLRITLQDEGRVIPRFVTLLHVLLEEEKPLNREELREKMFSAGVGDSIGQTGRLLSNVSQLLTKPGNEHLRQIVRFDTDMQIDVGAVKDNYYIPSEYKTLVRETLEDIQTT